MIVFLLVREQGVREFQAEKIFCKITETENNQASGEQRLETNCKHASVPASPVLGRPSSETALQERREGTGRKPDSTPGQRLLLAFYYSHPTACQMISYCAFDWNFSDGLMTSCIFSCACWPLEYFL